jgi:hypothetical protein
MSLQSKILMLLILLLGLGGYFVYSRLTLPPPPTKATEPGKPPENVPRKETEEEKARRQVLGVWQDNYQGKRTMTLNEDGTGTMLVELTGLQATLVAPQLRFDMQWTLQGKVLQKRTVGGEPADKVNLILNTMGNTAEDTILEVSADQLLLLDKDGKTHYDWKRIKQDEGRRSKVED